MIACPFIVPPPQYTFALLCLASLLQTAKQYFGDPIDCIVDGRHQLCILPIPIPIPIPIPGVPGSVFKTYCWIHGTFTLPSQLTGNY